jgi:hypothetical protein
MAVTKYIRLEPKEEELNSALKTFTPRKTYFSNLIAMMKKTLKILCLQP